MASSSRSTKIASLLERFLDDNENDLSPNMYKELDDLAGTIDEEVYNLESTIEELEEEMSDLENRIEILEGENN